MAHSSVTYLYCSVFCCGIFFQGRCLLLFKTSISLSIGVFISNRCVHGTDSDNVYFGGGNGGTNAGAIYHWNGVSITKILDGGASFEIVRDIWCVSKNNIWAVTEDGKFLHYNGSTWSLVACPKTNVELTGIFAYSADNIWAVGFDTVINAQYIFHYNGLEWLTNYTNTDRQYLFDVTGTWT